MEKRVKLIQIYRGPIEKYLTTDAKLVYSDATRYNKNKYNVLFKIFVFQQVVEQSKTNKN